LGCGLVARVSALPLKACHKKQEKFHPTLETIDGKDRNLDEAKRNPAPPALM
jgi:hypothetical protein